jgi:hypothetical protein
MMCETRLLNFLDDKDNFSGDPMAVDECVMCTKDTKIFYKGTKWRLRRLIYTLCTPASVGGTPTGLLRHLDSSELTRHMEHEQDQDNNSDDEEANDFEEDLFIDAGGPDGMPDLRGMADLRIDCDGDPADSTVASPKPDEVKQRPGWDFEKSECVNPLHQTHEKLHVAARNKYGTSALTEGMLRRHYPAAVKKRKLDAIPVFRRSIMHDLFATIPKHLSVLRPQKKSLLKRKFFKMPSPKPQHVKKLQTMTRMIDSHQRHAIEINVC